MTVTLNGTNGLTFNDDSGLLYHGGYDAWKAAIQAVKDKYPKPE